MWVLYNASGSEPSPQTRGITVKRPATLTIMHIPVISNRFPTNCSVIRFECEGIEKTPLAFTKAVEHKTAPINKLAAGTTRQQVNHGMKTICGAQSGYLKAVWPEFFGDTEWP